MGGFPRYFEVEGTREQRRHPEAFGRQRGTLLGKLSMDMVRFGLDVGSVHELESPRLFFNRCCIVVLHRGIPHWSSREFEKAREGLVAVGNGEFW